MKKLSLGVLLLTSVLLTACGGGGGGNPSGISFPTNSVLAESNQENGEKVAKATVSKSVSYGLNNVGDSSGANSSLIVHNVSNILFENIKNLPQSNALNAIDDIGALCAISGTVSGSVNTDTGAYNATFNSCKNVGFDAISGSTSGVLKSEGGNLKKMSFKVTRTLSIEKGSDLYSTMQTGSSMAVEYSVAGSDHDDITITMSAIGVENNQKYGCKNCEFHIQVLANHDIQIYQTKGQLYIGDGLEAYVIYDTSHNMSATPFVFSNSDGQVNNGGIAKYTSKDDKVLEIRAMDNGNAELWIDGTFSKLITLL